MPHVDDDFDDDDLDVDEDDLVDDLEDDDDDVDDEEDWETMTPEGSVAILERAIADGAGFMRNGRILMPTAPMSCRHCGCTDERACPGGCFWVAPHLCSRCAP